MEETGEEIWRGEVNRCEYERRAVHTASSPRVGRARAAKAAMRAIGRMADGRG